MFRFKLATVLSLALHEEDEVKKVLALKDGQIAEVEAKIQGLIGEYNLALEAKTEDLISGKIDRIRMYPSYLLRLKKTEAFYCEEKERLLLQREKIFEEFIEKRRVRKIYEKIKEREETKYNKEQIRKLQKMLDDVGNRRNSNQGEEHA